MTPDSFPRIALNASLLPHAEDPAPSISLRSDYTDSIERAGGLPFILPPLNSRPLIIDVMSQFDGLVLVGGGDIHAERYGQKTSPLAKPLLPRREAFDFLLLEAALELGMPVLGICLGCQTINVHYGGSLYQDLLSDLPELAVRHSQHASGYVEHPVQIAPSTRMAQAVGDGSLLVNSSHHQAVRELGRGLVASAHSEDGLIEALEDPARDFVVGVQWHPEALSNHARHAALFSAFVSHASAYRQIIAAGHR